MLSAYLHMDFDVCFGLLVCACSCMPSGLCFTACLHACFTFQPVHVASHAASSDVS